MQKLSIISAPSVISETCVACFVACVLQQTSILFLFYFAFHKILEGRRCDTCHCGHCLGRRNGSESSPYSQYRLGLKQCWIKYVSCVWDWTSMLFLLVLSQRINNFVLFTVLYHNFRGKLPLPAAHPDEQITPPWAGHSPGEAVFNSPLYKSMTLSAVAHSYFILQVPSLLTRDVLLSGSLLPGWVAVS